MDLITQWIGQYGYAAMFVLLMLGIVGVPVPDELLLTFCGYLVWRGDFTAPWTMAVAMAGACCGITLSYLIGRSAGLAATRRLGRLLRFTPQRVERVHEWFERRGRWTLVLGYYVPGVRHLTAIVAGTARMRYRSFALFAYGGALIWSQSWIWMGMLLGHQAMHIAETVHRHLVVAAIAIAVAAAVALVVRRWLAGPRGSAGEEDAGTRRRGDAGKDA